MTRFDDLAAFAAVVREGSFTRAAAQLGVSQPALSQTVRALVWPRLLPWLPRYPDIRVEISSDNRFTDIVAERFDIGVRLGADVAKDMIAMRMAPDMRMAVVGAPDYFVRHPRPRAPQDLTEHDCIGLRLPSHGGLLKWEFARRGRSVSA